MSKTVDERVVEMRFDNKNFESNVATSMSTLEKFKQKLKFDGATKGLEDINSASKRVNMSGLGSSVDAVSAKFSALQVMGVTALANITNSAVNAGKQLVSAFTIDPIKSGFQEYETQINAVQTILANTESKGSTLQDVNNALAELNTYADKTIYNFTEMTRNIGAFTAAGVDLKTSVSAIKGIANLAAVSGSTSQQASTAMYQLSQALSSGTVKLQDWNSVVNAGMGGQVFQDALKETARVHGIAIDKMIKDEGSFRETLQEGWLTSDILTETLEKFTMAAEEGSEEWKNYKQSLMDTGYTEAQAISILKMANTAANAATKVKTFTQLMDTLKEAAQSGWTKSWEIMIGDFEEAKDFLTDVSDRLGEIIGKSADSRNAMLSEGLSSGWKQLLSAGIFDEEGYKETFKAVAQEHGASIDDMIAAEKKLDDSITDTEAFQKALKTGFKDGSLSADMLTESVHKMADKMSNMSAKELEAAGYTADHVKQIKELSDGLKNGTISMDEFVDKIMRPSGRENIIQALWNSFNALMDIIEPVKKAFRDVFPAITGDQLYTFTEKLRDLTANFKLTYTQSANLRHAFRGIFSVIKVGVNFVQALANGIIRLVSHFSGLGGNILKAAGSFGTWLDKLSMSIIKSNVFENAINKAVDVIILVIEKIIEYSKAIADWVTGTHKAITESEWFQAAVKNISTFLSNCATKIQEFASAIKDWFTNLKETISESDAIGQRVESITAFFETAIEKVKEFISSVKEKLTMPGFEGFLDLMGGIWKVITVIGDKIKSVASSIGSALVEVFRNGDISGVLDLLNGGLFAAILLGIKKFINGFGDTFDGVSGLLEGAKDVLDGVKGSLEAWQKDIQANTLLKIAGSIAILTSALVVLAMIDQEKLNSVLLAISGLFVDLVGSMTALEKFGGDGVSMKSAVAMLAMSTSVLILAGAIKKISSLSWDEMGRGLTGVTALLGEIVAASILLSKYSGKASRGAVSMVIMAAALKILASVCKDLSELSWKELGKGVAGIGAILLEFIGFQALLKLINPKKMLRSATSLVIIGAAMEIFADVCNKFGQMKWESLGKAGAAIGGILVLAAGFALLSGMAKKMFKSSVALVIIGAAMEIFADVCNKFGQMDWESLGKAGAAMAGIILLAAGFALLSGLAKKMIKSSVALVIIGTAMEIFADVCNKFGKMKWKSLSKAGAAIGGILVLAAGFALLSGLAKGMLKSVVSLTIMAAAMEIFADVCNKFGQMDWESLGKAGAAMAGILLLAAGFALLSGLSSAILSSSVALLIMAAALNVLSPVLVTLGGMSWESIAKGLVTLAGAFAIIGVAGLLLGPITPTIIGVSVAIALLGAACLMIGAGVSLFAAGLTALTISATAGATALVAALTIIITGVLSLIPAIVEAIGEAIVAFCTAITEAAPAIGDAVKAIVLTIINVCVECIPPLVDGILQIVDAVLASLVEYAPTIIDSLIMLAVDIVNGVANRIPEVLQAVMNLIGSIFQGAIDALNGVDAETLVNGVLAVGAIAGILAALNAITGLIPGAMLGVLGIAAVVAEIGLILAALGGLAQIPGLEWLITEGGNLLQTIGTALGQFVGGIVGGFGKGVSDVLPDIGQNISDFMGKLAEAGEKAQGIPEGAFDGVKDLIDVMASIALTTVGTSISDIFTLGGTSMEKFQTDGVAFFDAMKAIGEASAGVTVNDESMNSVITMASKLVELQSSLEPIGGVIDWFTGRDDLGTFGTNVDQFMSSMTDALGSLDGSTFNEEALSAIITASRSLATLQSSLEPIGGVITWFTGRDDLGTFGLNVGQFIYSMKTAFSSLDEVEFNTEAMGSIVNAATSLANLQSSLEPIGGVITWFTGRDDLGTFGVNVGQFISSMKTAFSSLDEVEFNTEAMDSIITASTSLATLQSSLKPIGGVISWFVGRDDLGTFGVSVSQFISSMKTALITLDGTTLNEEALASVITAAEKLSELQDNLSPMGGVVDWFAGRTDLGTFGTNVGLFADAMGKLKTGMGENGISEEVITSVTNAGQAIIALQEALPTEGWFDGKMNLTEFSNYITDFSTAMATFSSKATEIDTGMVSTCINTAYKIKNLIESLVGIDTSGVEIFTGIGTGGIGADGPAYDIARSIAKFSDKVADIDTGAVTVAVSAATRLKSLIAGLVGLDTSGIENFKPGKIGDQMQTFSDKVSGIDTGKVSSSISSANRLKNFISSLSGLDTSGVSNFKPVTVGSALNAYSSSISGFNTESVNSSIAAATRLKNFITSLAGLDSSGVANFKSAVESLAQTNLAGIQETFNSAANELASAGSNIMESIIKGMTKRIPQIIKNCTILVTKMHESIVGKTSVFTAAGLRLMQALATGILSGRGKVISASTSSLSYAASSARGYYSSFYSAGAYLVSGFAAGISANTYKAVARARAMANAAAQAAKAALDINSPSKVFKKIGYSVPEGFAMGIDKMSGMVKNSSVAMTNTALNGTKQAVAGIAEMMSIDADYQPTIRPVLDLSDVESGAGSIASMFNSSPSIGINSNLRAIGSMINENSQNGSNDDIVSAINKLRKGLDNVGNTTYTINGVTYDDGSNIHDAMSAIVRQARIERRV